jgi:hypothetical protein
MRKLTVPTSAWYRDKLKRDNITFFGTSKRVDMVTRARVREANIKTPVPHGVGRDTPSVSQTGADQPVRN